MYSTGMFTLKVFRSSNTLRDMTFRREPLSDLRKYALSAGMVSLREDGVRKVLAGVTTVPEVQEVTAKDIEAEVEVGTGT